MGQIIDILARRAEEKNHVAHWSRVGFVQSRARQYSSVGAGWPPTAIRREQTAAPPPLRTISMPVETTGSRCLLVMAIHPKCPCSRASVGELARLASRFRDQLRCVVLAYQPHEQSANWIETDLVATVRGLPSTKVLIDVDGRDAAALGMSTSGAVVLCSPQGEPLFWGGTAIGRGHCGDNLGSDAITSVLTDGQLAQASQPVYGCRIQSDPGIDADSPQRQGAKGGHSGYFVSTASRRVGGCPPPGVPPEAR